MGSMFDDEPATGRLNPNDCIGHLLMVWAIDYIEHSPTKFSVPGKNSDVIVVDAVNLDEPDHDGYQGCIYRHVWWRNGRLIGFLKAKIGRPKPVLARMAVGINTMGKPPFELELANHDEDAVARATAWMQAHPDFRAGVAQPNPDSERVLAEPPTQAPKSQLQEFAERTLTGGNLHQQSLRLATTMSDLPPARPPVRPQPVDDPPF